MAPRQCVLVPERTTVRIAIVEETKQAMLINFDFLLTIPVREDVLSFTEVFHLHKTKSKYISFPYPSLFLILLITNPLFIPFTYIYL